MNLLEAAKVLESDMPLVANESRYVRWLVLTVHFLLCRWIEEHS